MYCGGDTVEDLDIRVIESCIMIIAVIIIKKLFHFPFPLIANYRGHCLPLLSCAEKGVLPLNFIFCSFFQTILPLPSYNQHGWLDVKSSFLPSALLLAVFIFSPDVAITLNFSRAFFFSFFSFWQKRQRTKQKAENSACKKKQNEPHQNLLLLSLWFFFFFAGPRWGFGIMFKGSRY